MIKQHNIQRHTIDEEAVIDSLAHRNAPRRRKYDLETAPRPPKDWRPKATEGTKKSTESATNKGDTNNSKPRFRKNVYIPGLDLSLNAPYWLSSAGMKVAQATGNMLNTIIGAPLGLLYEGSHDAELPLTWKAYKSIGKDEYKKSDYDDTDESMPQNTYLMSREGQRKAMENKGYVYKGNSDEDYRKTFVTNRARHLALVKGYNPPVYQTQPDEVHEETWTLIPRNYKGDTYFYRKAGFGNDVMFSNKKAEIHHGGDFPLHLETDASGQLYIQGDDVNDYQNVLGFDVLNPAGRPTIITTGPRALSEKGRQIVLGQHNNELNKYNVEFNGKESPLVAYLKDPSHNLVMMNEYYPRVGYSTNETVVTPHGNYTKPKQWNHSRMRLGGRNTILEHSRKLNRY